MAETLRKVGGTLSVKCQHMGHKLCQDILYKPKPQECGRRLRCRIPHTEEK